MNNGVSAEKYEEKTSRHCSRGFFFVTISFYDLMSPFDNVSVLINPYQREARTSLRVYTLGVFELCFLFDLTEENHYSRIVVMVCIYNIHIHIYIKCIQSPPHLKLLTSHTITTPFYSTPCHSIISSRG